MTFGAGHDGSRTGMQPPSISRPLSAAEARPDCLNFGRRPSGVVVVDTVAALITAGLVIPHWLRTGDGVAVGIVLSQVLSAMVLRRGVRLGRRDLADDQAVADDLTGLLTAATWRRLAGHQLATSVRRGGAAGMLLIDLDRFSRINEVHGRRAGDQVLRAVADTVSAEAGPHELAARFGADEFVLLIPGADICDALKVAERIRARIHELSVMVRAVDGSRTVVDRLSVSIGAAGFPDDGLDLDDLVLTAEMLLFAAKDNGRDQVRAARPGFRSTGH